MKLVKAWSGKWHIFEGELGTVPAIPKRVVTCDGTTTRWPEGTAWNGDRVPAREEPCENTHPKVLGQYKRECWVCREGGKQVLLPLPQPLRRRALTLCGEEVLVKDEKDVTVTAEIPGKTNRWGRNTAICSKCPITRRLPL